jgi:hypothetical protein
MKSEPGPVSATLATLAEPLRAQLALLKQAPAANKPFVLVEDEVTGRFVQFAGGDTYGPTLFDVPGRVEYPDTDNPIGKSVKLRTDSIDALVSWAVTMLGGPLRLPENAKLRIYFETTQEEEPS